MRDEMDARLWVEHHEAFSSSLGDFFAKLGVAMKRLNEIQFHAPWRRKCSIADTCDPS